MFLIAEVLFFFATLLTSLTVFNRFFQKKKSSLKCPPAIPALPIVGSFPFLMNGVAHMPKFMMKKSDELGPIFTLKIGNKLCLVLSSYDVIQEALVKSSATFSGRQIYFLETYSGNKNRKGIVAGNLSAYWKFHQKLSLSILKEFGFGDKNVTERRISFEVMEVIKFIKSRNGQPFDPNQLTAQISSNVINQITFADRCPYENGLSPFSRDVIEFIDSMSLTFEMAPWLRFLPYFKPKAQKVVRMNTEILRLIKEYIDGIKSGEREDCFVSKYLEKQGPDCESEQMQYIIRDIAAAGTDTTANTILWCLLFLAKHQDIQKRIQKEIDEAVPRSQLPSLEHKKKLPYFEAFTLEVQRIKTLLPFSIPHVTLSNTELRGYFIPAGTMVLVNLYAVHMDPKYWTDPEQFNPERFLDKDNNIINSERCIPFSLGRRSCLGEVLARQEVYQIVSGLVQNFVILPPENHEKINDEEILAVLMKPSAFQVRMKYRI